MQDNGDVGVAELAGTDVDVYEPNLDGAGLRIAVAVSRFNSYAGKGLFQACFKRLRELGVAEEDITVVTVPGALELPLVLDRLGQGEEYDALIALGAVVRGETYHFDLVSNESASGITRVSIDASIPIANGVLTCENKEQVLARMDEKGAGCAECAVEMANLLAEISDFAPDEDDEEELQ
ncbi:MAG: 6,7-dimethyl-8-ribityllumazine synthase [Duodenibacillus sp.]|nr:6,7-dimethyl-8-ribityllumazine synthase [Duodenibacillus sp.]